MHERLFHAEHFQIPIANDNVLFEALQTSTNACDYERQSYGHCVSENSSLQVASGNNTFEANDSLRFSSLSAFFL